MSGHGCSAREGVAHTPGRIAGAGDPVHREHIVDERQQAVLITEIAHGLSLPDFQGYTYAPHRSALCLLYYKHARGLPSPIAYDTLPVVRGERWQIAVAILRHFAGMDPHRAHLSRSAVRGSSSAGGRMGVQRAAAVAYSAHLSLASAR